MAATAKDPAGQTVKLKDRDEVAESTLAFRFERPPGWTFKAGQTVDITLVDPQNDESGDDTRTFSIASPPNEETLMVATRMRDSSFKRTLGSLPLGTAVKIKGPFGNFLLHNNPAKTAVLITGGIGVTPFRSMVFRAANEKLSHRIFLFYSNRRPEDSAFLKELETLEKENPNYKLIATMTQMEKSSLPWHGETGHIDKEMLSRYLKDAPSPVYYIAGPPGMVKGLRGTLEKAGVDNDDIRAEDFSGY